MYKTLSTHESKKLTDNASSLWEKELQKKHPSLYTVLRTIYAKKIFTVSLIFTVVDAALR